MKTAAAEYGKIIKALRESKGLTQEAVAQSSKLQLSDYQDFENGKKEPLLVQFMAISEVLGVPASDLISKVYEGLGKH